MFLHISGEFTLGVWGQQSHRGAPKRSSFV